MTETQAWKWRTKAVELERDNERLRSILEEKSQELRELAKYKAWAEELNDLLDITLAERNHALGEITKLREQLELVRQLNGLQARGDLAIEGGR